MISRERSLVSFAICTSQPFRIPHIYTNKTFQLQWIDVFWKGIHYTPSIVVGRFSWIDLIRSLAIYANYISTTY